MNVLKFIILLNSFYWNYAAVNFIDTSFCGGSKGCWLMPPDCSRRGNFTDCQSIVTWSSGPDGLFIEIEGDISKIEGNAGKYVSMAFSYDDKMGEDSVLECVSRTNGSVAAYLSFNDETHNFRLPQASRMMLKNTEGAVIDGRIVCRTLRSFDPPAGINEEDKFKLFKLKEQDYTLLFARGPATPDRGDGIGMHYLEDGDLFPWVARETIHVLKNKNIHTMKHYDVPRSIQYQLVKVHGVFMLFGWWIFAAIANLFSRFFKNSWPNTKLFGTAVWFQFHRELMIASLILQSIAFGFVFIQAGDFKTCSYVCTSDDYTLQLHTILGVASTAAALIQPFMAWIRPNPKSPSRPIFNWCHWFLGVGSWVLATVTIFLSTPLGKSGLRRNYKFVPDYLMAGYIASYILASLLLEIICSCYESRLGIKPSNAIKLAPASGPKSVVSNGTAPTTNQSRTMQDTLQLVVLLGFIIIALGLVITLTVFICM